MKREIALTGAIATITAAVVLGLLAAVLLWPSSSSYGRITDGDHVVGSAIAPGTYRSQGPDAGECFWGRNLRRGIQDRIPIAGGRSTGPVMVTIEASDHEFVTYGCGEWTKVR